MAEPRIVTGNNRFAIDAGDAKMSVFILAPNTARTTIEAYEMRPRPGRRGSVDKGEGVVSGQRLAASTEPATSVQFNVKLRP